MNRGFLVSSVFLLSAVWDVFPSAAHGVNIYDGIRAPEGLYLLTYSSMYHAEDVRDSNGDISRDGYGYYSLQEIFRAAWYHRGFVFSALVPVGGVYVDSAGRGSFGLGDITAGAGFFLPVACVDILPMVFVKFPSGEYDSSETVNYGSGQYDIRPMVFIFKSAGGFTFDGVVKYYRRFNNSDTGVKPGDEIHLQGVVAYNLTGTFRAGPSVSLMRGRNREVDGEEQGNTAVEMLSVGGDFYVRAGCVGITFTWLNDIHSRNMTDGNYYQIKTVLKF
ncbi:MAG TPA: transporter [Spirochaetota bacterium]|nr:transporter [Spirochaetota bacterium]HQP49387.1 transporter [Spirochaetota bacterium]